MKTKGISFLEQHVEKIVLGAVGVVFFSVLAWQLFPTTVKLDGKDVSLSDVDKEIEARTATLNKKLDEQREPLEKQLGGKLPQQLTGQSFTEKLNARVAPAADLPQIEPRYARLLKVDGTVRGATYHVPEFTAVAMGQTIQVDDTLEETVIKQYPQIGSYFATSSGPLDISWLVPSAVLDLDSMRAELDKSAEGVTKIPDGWYRDSLFIVDVQFLREEATAESNWGNPTLVGALPGAFTLRDKITQNPNAQLRDAVWESLSDKSTQRSILQPEFLPTKRSNFSAGMMLATPGTVNEGESPEIRSLRKSVAKLAVEIRSMTEDLKELGGPLEAKDDKKDDKKKDASSDDESDTVDRPGGGTGLGSGSVGGKRAGSEREEAATDKRIKLTKAVKEKERRLGSLEQQLTKLGAAVEAANAANSAPFDVKSSKTATIWAHDIAVSQGKTYRYRAVVKTYNPFFTNAGVLDAAQKPLGEPFTMDSLISPWSDPVTVTPRIAFFVTDAVPSEGRLGVGQATVEVFCYRDGERRVERFTVQPGDSIGSGKDKDGLNYETGFYLVDVIPDPTTERGGSDRRAAAVAIVQSATGSQYEVRIPKEQTSNPMRLNFQDEIEIAKAEAAAKAPVDGEKAAGDGTIAPPKAPGGGLGAS